MNIHRFLVKYIFVLVIGSFSKLFSINFNSILEVYSLKKTEVGSFHCLYHLETMRTKICLSVGKTSNQDMLIRTFQDINII